MAYIPTNWVNGDIVTSEKLNKAEQGIKNATIFPANVNFIKFSVIEHVDEQTQESTIDVNCDLTPAEVRERMNDGKLIIGILSLSTLTFPLVCCMMTSCDGFGFDGYLVDFETASNPAFIYTFRIYESNDAWEFVMLPTNE